MPSLFFQLMDSVSYSRWGWESIKMEFGAWSFSFYLILPFGECMINAICRLKGGMLLEI
jgi:hypothetical protein